MRLEVDLMVYKRRLSPLRVTLEKITIKLGNESTHILTYFPQSPINFSKFRRKSERIIRELSRGAKKLRIESPSDIIWSKWVNYEYLEAHYVCWVDSEDLMKVGMGRELKSVVKSFINRRITKIYTRNPSKPKSDMEYRKRAYYGKCKR
jgi:hypothetical protein